MTCSRLLPRFALIALFSIAAVLLPQVAGADVDPEHALAFGYLTEHADAVVGAPIERRGKPPGWRNRLPMIQGMPATKPGQGAPLAGGPRGHGG